MNLGLRNKKAIVCGSTKGIGKSIAEELALQGVSITLIARNQNALQEVTSSLDVSLDQKHDFLCVDFSANNFLSISPEDRSFSKVECFNISSSIVLAGIIIFFLTLKLFFQLQLLLYQLFHLLRLSYFVHQKDKAYCFLFHHL